MVNINWRLFGLTVVIISIPVILMGFVAFYVFKAETLSNVKKELSDILLDWRTITEDNINQSERLLKREEVLVNQRLSSVAFDVKKMMELTVATQGLNTPPSAVEELYKKIASIRLGQSGYVYVLTSDGRYVISKGRLRDGESILNIKENGEPIIKNLINRASKLAEDESFVTTFDWQDDSVRRPLVSAVTYFKPWNLIVVAAMYYSDFRSFELQNVFQDELRSQMAKRVIHNSGYIWVINSSGDYVVSKDKLRDGENLLDIKDASDKPIVQQIIDQAKSLKAGEVVTRQHFWRNIGEVEPREQLTAITYVPQWDWVIGVSTYLDDFLKGLIIIRLTIILMVILAIILGSILTYVLVRERTKGLQSLNQQLKESNQQLVVSEQQLKASNQQMVAANQQLRASEKKLQEKVLELERFKKVTIGRELKMVELKKEIERLQNEVKHS